MRRTAAALLAPALLAGCTAVIDQSSFFPASATPPATQLVAPPGYRMDSALVPLAGLGAVHVVRLDNPANDRTIVYSGGNGSFTAAESPRAAALAEATGADIILYDYPGRGGTTVPATIDASIATGPALVDALKARGWIGDGPLYAYGLSFGGSQAAAMVRRGDFDGLIIEGSAADIARVGRNFVPGLMRPFVRLRIDPELGRFDYLGYAASAGVPVLLISSTDDSIVTPRNMAEFDAALRARGVATEMLSVPGAHGTALRDPATREAVARFTRR